MAILKGPLVKKEWAEVIFEIEDSVRQMYNRALFPYKNHKRVTL